MIVVSVDVELSKQTFGYLTAFENQLCRIASPHSNLVEFGASTEALHSLFDDECGDASRLLLWRRFRIDDKRVCDGSIRNPETVMV